MAGILGAITRALTPTVKKTVEKAKTKAKGTSEYKNTAPVKTYNDEQTIIDPSGETIGSYSEQRAMSKNGTAYVPGYGEVPITITNGKVQETNLPIGTIVNTAGGTYQITGANANGYVSTPYTGTYGISNKYNDSKNNVGDFSKYNSGGGISNVVSNNVGGVSDVQNTMNPQVDSNSYIQQMQAMYEKQMADFKSQLDSQQLITTQNTQKQQLQDNYLNANKTNTLSATNGTLGNTYSGYKSPKGAQIKTNSSGQPGAISRYLATDMWKNK